MNRWALACIGAVSLATTVMAQPLVGGWTADPKTGCRVWNAYPTPEETISWEGGCVNGYLQGKGVLRWYNNNGQLAETVNAEYRQGKLNGHAVLIGATFRFEGNFRNHVPNGPGTLKLRDGQVYSGNWVNGCIDDHGRRFAYMVTRASCGLQ